MIIGLHHILSGYGFWGVNDVRGSGSFEIGEDKFEPLGPIHHGRKRVQPPRPELRAYHREVEELLDHPLIWFTEEMRDAISKVIGEVAQKRGYTIWAHASLRNHAHVLTRVHRDNHLTQWGAFADATRDAIRSFPGIYLKHPVWSLRPYTTFKNTPELVRTCVKYIDENPEKEGLPRQSHDFVVSYDGFPFHKKRS